MYALVTGDRGFIGNYLVGNLKDKGFQVQGYDKANGLNIMNEHDLYFHILNCDIVFHLAAETGVPRSWHDPYLYYEVNVVGSAKVFKIARELGKKVIFASTGEVYVGNSPYAASKVAAEAVMQTELIKGADIVSLRILNPYGIGQPRTYVIPIFMRKALAGDDIILHGGGEQRKDYIYVSDLAELFYLASKFPAGDKLDAGSGETTSIKEIAENILRVTGSKSKLISTGGGERVGEREDLKGDLTPFFDMGWKPQVSLLEGLKLVKEHYGL